MRTLTVGTLLEIAGALAVRLDLEPRWRGGDLGRTLNSGHSAMHERLAAMFAGLAGWVTKPEVSFSIYGERGVIDVLAFHTMTRALLVVELKTDLVDANALLGTVDRYTRLARHVAAERGWRATTVSCWVVLRDTMTNRRRVAAHVHLLRAAFPVDRREMRAWLRNPTASSVRALSFVSEAHRGSVRGSSGVGRRVRVPLDNGSLAQREAGARRIRRDHSR